MMDNMLKIKIFNQRIQLETLINCSSDLLNDDVLHCSEKMDKLINEFHMEDNDYKLKV